MLSSNYIHKGLLFHKPSSSASTLSTAAGIVDHVAATLGDALLYYYPVAGRFATEQHRDEFTGAVIGCSVHIDCDGQGVDVVHAAAHGVTMADVLPRDADVPRDVLAQLFLLTDAVNYGGQEQPLFAVQVTDLAIGVFVGFAYNHALSDGTAFWDFVNYWAAIARASLGLAPAHPVPKPSFERWSHDGGKAGPAVLPCADLSELIEQAAPTPLRERMLHFSADSLVALKERARGELLAAGDTAGAADLLERGHGWAAAAVGWAVMGSSPRFDMYGCDFGWGTPVAARSGKANKFDGKTSLYPGPEGGGTIDAELTLTSENMAALEQDEEFWAAVTPDAPVRAELESSDLPMVNHAVTCGQ